ncbi:MAG: hypothetical protein QM654_12960 [Dysgonamonadaceae bacterium]
MGKRQDIRIGDAVITPAALATLEGLTGNVPGMHNASDYADWIDDLKERFLVLHTQLDFESEIETMKLHSELFRLLLALRENLLTFVVEKGGES